MGRYFGTDGIRGRFGDDWMTEAFAFRLAFALARYIRSKASTGATGSIVLGRDTRASGLLLERALQAGFEKAGLSVVFLGVVPTPAVAMAVLEHSASMGIALTASHNPASDNGIKLFNQRGEKYSVADEAVLEDFIDQVSDAGETEYLPTASTLTEYTGADFYQRALLSNFPSESLKGVQGMKIVLDCANGATYQTAPSVLNALGADLVLIGVNPDGENINCAVGSECPDLLAKTVLAEGAALGIAHDGDGDRLVVCDERGSIVDGDALLGVIALSALRRQSLSKNTLVVTVQSNLGLDRTVLAAGGCIERVSVGDRNVAEKMRSIGAHLGGESSGHILFSNLCPTGDGLLAALCLLQLLEYEGRALSELQAEVQLFPQVTQNLRVKEKIPLEDLPNLQKAIQKVEAELVQNGRLLIRYSGTEAKLRILIEAESTKLADQLMQIIVTEACISLSIP